MRKMRVDDIVKSTGNATAKYRITAISEDYEYFSVNYIKQNGEEGWCGVHRASLFYLEQPRKKWWKI